MLRLDAKNTFKRLRNHYRLVVMNEDTYEEVVKFKLSRLSVYIVLSATFVLLMIFTVSLIVFTPIKYYIPGVGYGDAVQAKEYRQLKMRTDSMENALRDKQLYMDDLKKVLQGNVPKMDTSKLNLPKTDNVDEY